MTPYAVLLVKPTDSDEIIRKAYHLQAEVHHPDVNNGEADAQWYTATTAYTAIKTVESRLVWLQKRELLANVCEVCAGYGVKGSRMFKGKIRLCEDCKGEGTCQ